jgi:predicted kinase
VEIMVKRLILMVGLPRSGKSTMARKMGYPIVCRDAIRKTFGGTIRYFKEETKVNNHEEFMIRSLFNAGHQTVIIDATHLKHKYRERWMLFSLDNDCWVEYKFVLTPLAECVRRAIKDYPDDPKFPLIIEGMYETSDMKELIPRGS